MLHRAVEPLCECGGAETTFVEILLAASIPAAITLLGVIVTVFFGNRQSRDVMKQQADELVATFQHQADAADRAEEARRAADGANALRNERIDLYRRTVEVSSSALRASAAIRGEYARFAESKSKFDAVGFEVRTFGHQNVRAATATIDGLLQARAQEFSADAIRRATSKLVGEQGAEGAGDPSDPSFFDEVTNRLTEMNDRATENERVLSALVEACRQALGSDNFD